MLRARVCLYTVYTDAGFCGVVLFFFLLSLCNCFRSPLLPRRCHVCVCVCVCVTVEASAAAASAVAPVSFMRGLCGSSFD